MDDLDWSLSNFTTNVKSLQAIESFLHELFDGFCFTLELLTYKMDRTRTRLSISHTFSKVVGLKIRNMKRKWSPVQQKLQIKNLNKILSNFNL